MKKKKNTETDMNYNLLLLLCRFTVERKSVFFTDLREIYRSS